MNKTKSSVNGAEAAVAERYGYASYNFFSDTQQDILSKIFWKFQPIPSRHLGGVVVTRYFWFWFRWMLKIFVRCTTRDLFMKVTAYNIHQEDVLSQDKWLTDWLSDLWIGGNCRLSPITKNRAISLHDISEMGNSSYSKK